MTDKSTDTTKDQFSEPGAYRNVCGVTYWNRNEDFCITKAYPSMSDSLHKLESWNLELMAQFAVSLAG